MSAEQTVLAARVREGRDRLGITKSDLARAVGVTVSYISRIESGERPSVSNATLCALSDHLGVSVERLLGRDGETQMRVT